MTLHYYYCPHSITVHNLYQDIDADYILSLCSTKYEEYQAVKRKEGKDLHLHVCFLFDKLNHLIDKLFFWCYVDCY